MRLGVWIAVGVFCGFVPVLHAKGKVHESCAEALVRLWNHGPNRWQSLGRKASGEHLFVRGVGARPDQKTSPRPRGAKAAMQLLSGEPSVEEHYVWVMSKLEPLEKDPTYERRLGTYSSPLSIAGRVNRIIDAGRLGVVPVAAVPAGELDIRAVESFALILPSQRGEPQAQWARDYLALTDELIQDGVVHWVPGSRGERFYLELAEAMQKHEQEPGDPYEAPALQRVFDQYEK